MVRVTVDSRKENLQVCDRYFVKRNDLTSGRGVVPGAGLHYRETEETGRPLGEILADLRIAGSL